MHMMWWRRIIDHPSDPLTLEMMVPWFFSVSALPLDQMHSLLLPRQ